MSGSFEDRVHVVPAGRVRTIYDAIPATITTIAITATTIRTVRGFLFPPRGSIPAEITGLNELLRVVPGSAPGVEHERHQDSRDCPDHERAAERLTRRDRLRDARDKNRGDFDESEYNANSNRCGDREDARHDHLPERASCTDVH